VLGAYEQLSNLNSKPHAIAFPFFLIFAVAVAKYLFG